MMVCLARQAAFSEMMPLVTHPVAKHGLALRVRTLCRGALRLGSALHLRLCRRLLWHREESVRNHIARLIWYEGPNVWRSGGREASEITDPGAQPLAGNEWSECTRDRLRDIVEGVMLPCLSLVLSQEGMRRWLWTVRKTIYICGCGRMYRHLWSEALILAHRQRAALRKYLFRVYAASVSYRVSNGSCASSVIASCSSQSRKTVRSAGG